MTLLSYNVEKTHLQKLWNRFAEVDEDRQGVWTVADLYKFMREPRDSMCAPVLNELFRLADNSNEGGLCFPDFLVSLCSFCALSTEEVLQFMFLVVDIDRNGKVEKEELLNYFSQDGGGWSTEPLFPVNNKNALDKFRGGRWTSLEFDGLAKLCETFPYISFPAYHVQETLRGLLLGKSFWSRLDTERMRDVAISHKKREHPVTGEKLKVQLPGRCSMAELLEYSNRKSQVINGRRVQSQDESIQSAFTKDRDKAIARCPLLRMIRNNRCMYHVPYVPEDALVATIPKSEKLPIMSLPSSQNDYRGDGMPGFGVPGLEDDSDTGDSSPALDNRSAVRPVFPEPVPPPFGILHTAAPAHLPPAPLLPPPPT